MKPARMPYRIELPFPPSVNTYWRRGPRSTYLSKSGRAYKQAVDCCVLRSSQELHPFTGRLAVEVELYPPDRRTRDVDNCSKAVLDSLGEAGVWKDDEQIDDLRLIRRGIRKGGLCVVTVAEI